MIRTDTRTLLLSFLFIAVPVLHVSGKDADKRGILPDTPPEIVALVDEYNTTVDPEDKEYVLGQLANAGLAGFKCAARTLRAEQNAEVLASGYRMLNECAKKLIVNMPDDSAFSDVFSVLKENVRYGNESAASLYIIMVVETGSLDTEIKENEKTYTTDPVAARLLACLYRYKGDSVNAARAGKFSNDDSLYTLCLQEVCNWKELFQRSSKEPTESANIEQLALRATYARLAEEPKACSETIERIIKLGQSSPDTAWFPVARALVLNYELDKAADFLIGVKKYGIAARILDAHMDYGKLRAIATNVSEEALSGDGGRSVDKGLDAIALSVTEPEYGPWSDRMLMGAWNFRVPDAPSRDVDHVLTLCRKGHELTVKGDEKGAGRLFRQASLLVLDDEVKRFTLAVNLQKEGYTNEAVRQYELIMGISFSPSRNFRNAVLELYAVPSALARKDYRAAMRYRQRDVLDLLRTDAPMASIEAYLVLSYDTLMFEAAALVEEEKIDEALSKADAANRILPIATTRATTLVKLLDRQGAKAQADLCFDRVFDRLKTAERNHVCLLILDNDIAWFAASCRRRLAEALPYAERTVALRPKVWQYMDTLAEVYFQSGKRERAIEWINKALQLSPQEPYLKGQLKRFETGDTNTIPAEYTGGW